MSARDEHSEALSPCLTSLRAAVAREDLAKSYEVLLPQHVLLESAEGVPKSHVERSVERPFSAGSSQKEEGVIQGAMGVDEGEVPVQEVESEEGLEDGRGS